MKKFKELKKNNHIKKKWNLNSIYLYNYKDFLNGRIRYIEYFKLIDYKIISCFPKDKDFEESYKINLYFINNENGKELIIEQDEDRYGNFKLLDKNTIKEIEYKKEDAFRLYMGLNTVLESSK